VKQTRERTVANDRFAPCGREDEERNGDVAIVTPAPSRANRSATRAVAAGSLLVRPRLCGSNREEPRALARCCHTDGPAASIWTDQQPSGLVLPGARHEIVGATPPRRIANTKSLPMSLVLMIRTTSLAP
jgi:hypothetical protein